MHQNAERKKVQVVPRGNAGRKSIYLDSRGLRTSDTAITYLYTVDITYCISPTDTVYDKLKLWGYEWYTFFFCDEGVSLTTSNTEAINLDLWSALFVCFFFFMDLHCVKWSLPDMVRVISWGFPAAALEQEAEARAWVRLGLLIVSVISWPLVPPAISPELPMTWLRSWDPAESAGKHISVIQLIRKRVYLVLFSAKAVTYTRGILLREAGHCDLSRCDGGGLQGQAGQWVDDDIGGHWRVSGGHELAARMGDEASVNAQGLREETALL